MERIQLILLILISSAYILTCGKEENDVSMPVPVIANDSLSAHNRPGDSAGNIFYSSWLRLPFSGSGANWIATVEVPGLTQDIISSHSVKVYFRTSPFAASDDAAELQKKLRVVPEPGKIIIDSDFYPDSLQFRYSISPDIALNNPDREYLNNLFVLR